MVKLCFKNKKFKVLSFIIIFVLSLTILSEKVLCNSVKKNFPVIKESTENSFQQIWHLNKVPEIFPQPVHVKYSDVYHPIYTGEGMPLLYLVASEDGEKRASAVFNRQLERMGRIPVPVVSDLKKIPRNCSLAIQFRVKKDSSGKDGGQSYQIKPVDNNKQRVIEASGSSVQGCIYSATALAQLITTRDSIAVLREAIVKDYPAYTRRIFSFRSEVEQIPDILDWMVRYRMDCMKLQPNLTPWWEVNKEFGKALSLVDQWKKKYGGVHIMHALHIYKGRHIVISNSDDRDALKKVIKAGIDNGVDRVMIAADDIAPFKNGEGYILTSEEDKAQFANMAEAHCFLMQDLRNWLDEQGAKCELYYCPAFYTYEDNNLGDMDLYKDTPWEQDAFGPFKRDLHIIGKNMPKDVFVIWTGPNVRTRKITDEDFEDWKENLDGRAPFLWDNTMYSHYPFTTTALFTSYENELPLYFHRKTAGHGMYMNGDATTEAHRAAYMTANDFLWNPAAYNPEQSIGKAIASLYGTESVSDILELRDAELAIRRLIGEKQLKSDIDTLWSAIYKVRNTISNNPSYYIRIYVRLKALRNQLKCSLPAADPNKSFQEQITELDLKRQKCLNSLKKAGLNSLVEKLKDELVKIP
jgi:hypothetical protein